VSGTRGKSNPDLDLTTDGSYGVDPLDRLRQTTTVQRERERRGQTLTCRVGDQSHRFVLADIHRDQQRLRRDPTDPSRTQRDITTITCTMTTPPGCSGIGEASVEHLRRCLVEKHPDLYQP
jgi:hypothetical protein